MVFGAGVFLLATVMNALVSRDAPGALIAAASLLPTGGAILLGILIACYGQSIQCFVDIEENTRETNRLLQTRSGSGPLSSLEKTTALRPVAGEKTTAKPPVSGSGGLGLTAAEREKEDEVKKIFDQL